MLVLVAGRGWPEELLGRQDDAKTPSEPHVCFRFTLFTLSSLTTSNLSCPSACARYPTLEVPPLTLLRISINREFANLDFAHALLASIY